MVCYLHVPSLKTKGELERCPRRRRAPGTRYSRKTKIYFGPRWNCHSSWLQSRVFHSWFTQSALKNFSTFTLKINRSSTSYVVCGLFEGPGKKERQMRLALFLLCCRGLPFIATWVTASAGRWCAYGSHFSRWNLLNRWIVSVVFTPICEAAAQPAWEKGRNKISRQGQRTRRCVRH